jgi:hypothetical protein
MARLGELVKDDTSKPQIRCMDMINNPDRTYMEIALYGAKTAKPGVIQFLKIPRLDSLLCPLAAMDRLLEEAILPSIHSPVFSYWDKKGRLNVLTKSAAINIYKKVWKRYDSKNQLSGHSFRVGGATYNWNDKQPLADIVRLGRWESKAYQVYLRKYSDEEIEDAKYIWNLMKKERDQKEAIDVIEID